VADSHSLKDNFLAKIEEQIDRAKHLATIVPADRLEWRPFEGGTRICDLLGHLLECLSGFCATLYILKPERLSHFASLRDLPVNHCCGVAEALDRMGEYQLRIREGFAVIDDEDLSRSLPTVFVAAGEMVLTLLLGNLEHLINHKHQLFFYLKLLGVPVGTADLYKLRGE
jgi:hypothetical protein